MKAIDLNTVKIRPMVTTDIPSTLNIWWTDVPRKDMLASQMGGRFDVSLIAEYEGRLIGFIVARLIYAGLPITGVAVIFFIAVQPEYQSLGVASLLLSKLKSNCKTAGIDTVRALVPKTDTRIARYFKKAGFSPSNIINYDIAV
jgi:ribosomal protein S18 acetylase RimI-like enzyme